MIDIVKYAFQALLGHRLRSVLSLLGVCIGVSSVILLTSLGEGARRYVEDQFASLGSNLLIIIPGKVETTGAIPGIGGAPNDLTIADGQALARRIRQVRKLAPVSMGTETVSRGHLHRDIPVIGTTHEMKEIRRLNMAIGTFFPESEMDRGAKVCVLGHKVHQELFGASNPVGQTVRIGTWRFRVIGVLRPRGISLGFDFDDLVMVPAVTGLRLFNKQSLFRILVDVTNFEEIGRIEEKVREVLMERHNDEEDFTMITQDSVSGAFGKILISLTMALAGIAAISLSVAGVGIMNVMLVSVSERTEEIGLLKALGVTGNQIMAVFVSEAVLLSLTGGVIGLALAAVLTTTMTQIYPSFPIEPPLWAIAAALFVSTFVGVVFGVMPARRATKLDAIQCLSHR